MMTSPSCTVPHNDLLPAAGLIPHADQVAELRAFAALQRMMMQKNKPLLHCADFVPQVMLHLPEAAAFIKEDDIGSVHLEVGAMKQATLDAFARSDFSRVRRHLALVADLFERADADLYDVLRISYLEALFLGETTAAHIAARGMLSRQMEHALRQAELLRERRRATRA